MSSYSGITLFAACAFVLVFACLSAGCVSGQNPASPGGATPAPATANTITIKDFTFSPATLTVKTGTTVTWVNEDSMSHTVVSDDGSGFPFTSPQLANGGSYPLAFTQAGTYPYHCSIHPSMKGTIVVKS
jgi:plastocyanin